MTATIDARSAIARVQNTASARNAQAMCSPIRWRASYDPAARRLEVAPKLDADGKVTITTPWIDLRPKR